MNRKEVMKRIIAGVLSAAMVFGDGAPALLAQENGTGVVEAVSAKPETAAETGTGSGADVSDGGQVVSGNSDAGAPADGQTSSVPETWTDGQTMPSADGTDLDTAEPGDMTEEDVLIEAESGEDIGADEKTAADDKGAELPASEEQGELVPEDTDDLAADGELYIDLSDGSMEETWPDEESREDIGVGTEPTPIDVLQYGDYNYTVTDGQVTITKYNGTEAELTVPETIDGYPVTTIRGFSSNDKLESIKLPSGVTEIGDYAFYSCDRLKSIELPSGLTSIGAGAFSVCRSLTSIDLPPGVTVIEGGLFENCIALKSVGLPSGVTSIGSYAFSRCFSLTDIELPPGITSIDDIVFSECRSLTGINLPQGVTSIGNRAFEYCSLLANINLPSKVTSIGNSAFHGCSSLTNIELPSGVTSIGDNVFQGCSSLASIDFPSGLTSIGRSAFAGCGFTSIELPSGLTSIEMDAFYYCSSLTDIDFPSGLTSIGHNAFRFCKSLTSIELPSGLLSIGKNTFSDCSLLASVKLPRGVEEIGSYAFYGASDDLVIYVYEGSYAETYVKDNNYTYRLIGKESVDPDLGESDSVFYYYIENGKAVITDYEWDRKIIDELIVPETLEGCPVTRIENVTIMGVRRLSLPSSLQEVELSQPVLDSYLEEITVAENNPYLSAKDGILYNRDKTELIFAAADISNATIPDSVLTMAEGAFAHTRVRDVYIGRGLKEISARAFEYAMFLEKIEIPYGVKKIADNAFSDCLSLESIAIPASVTSIGSYAFAGCEQMESATFGNGVESIGEHSFDGCLGLKSVDLPVSVTSIGSYAFSGCEQMEFATFGNGVGSIGADIMKGVEGRFFAIQGTKIYEYLKENYGDLCGSGIMIGDYTSGIYVKETQSLKFLKRTENGNNESYRFVLTREVELNQVTIRLMSAEDDRELASVPYTDEDLTTEISLSHLDRSLPPDTEIYFVLSYETVSESGKKTQQEWSSKGIWSKKTLPDYWSVQNLREKIPDDMYTYVLGGLRGRKFKKSSDGTGGVCFGMAASAAMVGKGNPPASSFVGTQEMWDANENSFNTELGVSAKEFWWLLHLYQKNPKISRKIEKGKNDFSGMLNAVEAMLNGSGDACVIGLPTHELMPFAIERKPNKNDSSENDEINIYVYDCNYPQSNFDCILTLKTQGSSILGWEYNVNGQSSDNADLDYCVIDDSFLDIVKSYRKRYSTIFKEKVDLLGVDLTKRPNMKVLCGERQYTFGGTNGGDLLTEVSNKNGEDTEQADMSYYWVDSTGEAVTFSGLPANTNVSLTGDIDDIQVSHSSQADVELDVKNSDTDKAEVTIIPAEAGDYTVQFVYDSESYPAYPDSVDMTGTSKDEIHITEDGNSLVVEGTETLTVTSGKDGQTQEASFDNLEQYDRIEVELNPDASGSEEGVVAKGDRNGDGICETKIPQTVPPTEISLDRTAAELCEGNILLLTATLEPIGASDASIIWNSSDPSVATVDDGKVTALKKGSTVITAKARLGKAFAICEITVNEHVWNAGETVAEPSCTEAGMVLYTCTQCDTTREEEIEALGHAWGDWEVTTPASTTVREVQIRTCDVCGEQETKEGDYAPTSGGSQGGSQTQGSAGAQAGTVSKPVLELTANSLKMQVKQSTKKFKVTKMAPGDALVSVKSGNTKIVKVSKVKANGTFRLKAGKKTGKAKLTVKLRSGLSKTIWVKVQKKKVKTSKISGLKRKVTLDKGKTLKLKPVLNPVTSQDKISYKSSKKSVATVSRKGVVRAKKKGTAKITVRAGKKKFTCTVTVR